jgi:hypothetical protein
MGGSNGADAPVPGADTSKATACLVVEPEMGPPPTVPMLTPACERYCAAMQRNCPNTYDTAARCWYACDSMSWTEAGDPMQDTIACRTNFAEAATDDPKRAEYCPMAGAITPGCGDICAMFCRAGARICPRSFPVEAACQSGCEADRERFKQTIRGLPPDAGESHDYYSVMSCRMMVLELAVLNRSYCDAAAPNKMCGGCNQLNFAP